VQIFSYRKGFLLVELLIAVGIAALVIVGGQTLIAQALRVSKDAQGLVVAHGLAQEVVAATQALQQEDWSEVSQLGVHHAALAEGKWSLMPDEEVVMVNGITYHRSLTIEEVRREQRDEQGIVQGDIVSVGGYVDSDAVRAVTLVTWGADSPMPKMVRKEQIVSNWRAPRVAVPEPPSNVGQGMWTFSEVGGDLLDSSVNENTLIPHGSLEYGRSAPSGTAVGFNNRNDYAEIADRNQSGLDGNGPLYVRAVVRRDSSKSSGSILEKWNTRLDSSYRLSVTSSGKIRFQVQSSGVRGVTIQSRPKAVPVGAWVDIVAIYDGRTVQLFMDGVAVASAKDYSGGVRDSSAPFRVGYSKRTGGFGGAIDEIEVYRSLP